MTYNGDMVLLEGDGWEVTLREVIFSIFIVGVMFFAGFLISQNIMEGVNARTMTYRQAIDINSNSEFEHGLNTDIGYAFVNGDLYAKTPVEYDGLDGKHLAINVYHQKEEMHVEHYTTTDSKGRVHHHTRTYWEWETKSEENLHSPVVVYCGKEFPYGRFDYSIMGYDTKKVKTGWRKRDVIEYVKSKMNATAFVNFRNGSISGSKPGSKVALSRKSMKDYREGLVNDHSCALFWVIWSILTVVVVVGFYYAENYWLED